ncbi:WEB family protein At3g51220 [Cornus florida]|uniref:WEB family protein At3g51220 n=1 Tax=Cornus florida TaxID=4283 RepID=UPI0028970228|nr:WEB family protein At3g51220 [Cornus florida]
MEITQTPEKPTIDYQSAVDTSRPFRSVKEAVAIFGDRLLTGEMYSPKPPFSFPKQETSWKLSPSPSQEACSPSSSTNAPINNEVKEEYAVVDTLKKIENELEETKIELKLLKERESETEVALASLNAELHKNMSKMAQAEATAAAAAKAVATSRSVSFREGGLSFREEERRDVIVRMEKSPTLAHILSIGTADKEGLFEGRKERKIVMKKKPVIPLVKDLFSRKKGSSTNLNHPLY